ncbi:MAG: sigma-70 family RNA polymerase sigma factor [Bacteroidota bacterium]
MGNVEKNIIQYLQKGDKQGIALIYDHYADTLYGVLLRMLKEESAARDVLQESLIKIWQKGQHYDPAKAKLFTWMLSICRNTAIDRLRVRQKKQSREIQIEDSTVYDKSENAIRPEHLDVADQVAKLEPKYQEVIRALFFKGMTQQEASEALDIPLGTVKTRLKIGLRELKKVFGGSAIPLLILHWATIV